MGGDKLKVWGWWSPSLKIVNLVAPIAYRGDEQALVSVEDVRGAIDWVRYQLNVPPESDYGRGFLTALDALLDRLPGGGDA